MANPENLIPLMERTKEERVAIARKGGLARTDKKKWAARLREIKKKGLTDENYHRIVAWMEEPESSALDIYLYLNSIKQHCENAAQMNQLAKTMIDLMKAHHGQKIKSENVHHVVNWTDEQKESVIKRLLEEDEE